MALESAILNLDITKSVYSSKKKVAKEHKEKPSTSCEAISPVVVMKMTYVKATKVIEAAKLAITMTGVKVFELNGNLLSHQARHPWEKTSNPM